MRKGIYILPNLFTSASLFCGFFALLRTLQEDFFSAATFILASGLLDGMDGKIARFTNSTAALWWKVISGHCGRLLRGSRHSGVCLGPGALWAPRLAGGISLCGLRRSSFGPFQHPGEHVESRFFSGLPTPAAAGLIATGILVFYHLGDTGISKHITVLITTYFLAFLMVSTVKYYGFKDIELFRRKPFRWLVIAILLIIVVAYEPEYTLFGLFFAYVISGPILTLALRRRRPPKPAIAEGKPA